MTGSGDTSNFRASGGNTPRRLFVYSGGFLTQPRIRRILALAGWEVKIGLPKDGDHVGVWGQSPTAPRGEAVAGRRDAPVVRIEDAWLRSLHPGRDKEPPLGLLVDTRGVHFDPAQPSDLEHHLATAPLDDTAQLDRARAAIERIRRAHLTKYSAVDPELPVPDPGYVLVIDQTAGDASVTASGADRATFQDMLVAAQVEHPGSQVVIKTHPETAAGHRKGHFGPKDASDRISLVTDAVSPWRLMDGAVGVYTVSSGLGFEAIFAGHKPRVFGQPFYAGWGLTSDERPVARRERKLSRAQLFAAAMMDVPIWYDPYRDALCEIEDVIAALEAQARAWREDRSGWVAAGMNQWKRPALQGFFGSVRKMRFAASASELASIARETGARPMVWASKDIAPGGAVRIEDGFLRSRGLGAALTPPLSLVTDGLGIYYDPTAPSDLERLIAESLDLPDAEIERSRALIARLIADGLSKYNNSAALPPELPKGHTILVPGQVEDDASIEKGAVAERTNLDLLARARSENPSAVILYKPHPDVVAGLRKGAVPAADAARLADQMVVNASPAALLGQVDELWTITSTMGFEALLRGFPVTCLGQPFYGGWGLTRDLAGAPERRRARPTLEQLCHAALIGYPRYFDPKTGLACPPEIVAERLATGDLPSPGPLTRLASYINRRIAPRLR
ncbi:MAG: capsular polysaccharide biosynthesis protein [Rhodobacteraceae bacterium]|nr:capsular polysaccharide biosynthesis protein [Paracoccaceae bacterium]